MKRLMGILTVVGLSSSVAMASAQSDLAQEVDINEGLLQIAAADKIRRECDQINARFFRAYSLINDLKDTARSRGYSDEEIDNFLNDKQEKARVRAARNQYFKSKGASNLDAQSLCVLGRDEIARNSQIGRLLKEK